MKFVITVPDHQYYLWQVLVQINNFRRLGIEQDTHYIFGVFNGSPSPILQSFIDNTNIKAHFHLFNDARKEKSYSVSLSPHLLERFCNVSNIMQTETVFLTDPDVIFRDVDFLKQYENDNVWYLSDVKSYVGVDYIKSKSPELFERMCEIVHIHSSVVEANNENAGGAQYIIKNTDSNFWHKAYLDSEELYKLMLRTSKTYCPEYPIQAWTASMWSFLWNGWYFGHEIKVVPEMDFTWASGSMEDWNKNNIFHNAGVIVNDGKYFAKTAYQVSPFNKELLGTKESASWNYIEEVKDTERNFPELLF